MKTKEIIVIIALFAVAIGFTVWYQNNKIKDTSEPLVCFGEDCFSVEIADEDAERTTGLMNRESLDADSGMLFIFEREGNYPFWMKNTLIPLDMIWLNSQGEIVYIFENAQPCTTESCAIITHEGSALYVVELNAGTVREKGIGVEQAATFELID